MWGEVVTPPAVGLGTLSRLCETVVGSQVLSVYLDARPAQAAGWQAQFVALAAHLPRPLDEAASARVNAMLSCESTLAYGTRSIALFAAAGGSAHAMVPLPAAVEPMAVLERVPWLEPLVGMLTSGGWGAAIVDWRSARLLRGGPSGLIEFAVLGDEIGGSAACSASVARGRVLEHLLEHCRRLVGMLARAHKRQPFERIALAAPQELWPLFERQLDEALRERLVGLLPTDGAVAESGLREAVASLLAHAQGGAGPRCGRSTATPLPGFGAATVSQTSARLLPQLPQGQLAQRCAPSAALPPEAPDAPWNGEVGIPKIEAPGGI